MPTGKTYVYITVSSPVVPRAGKESTFRGPRGRKVKFAKVTQQFAAQSNVERAVSSAVREMSTPYRLAGRWALLHKCTK